METGVIIVSVVVGLFGVASAVLGFIAEGTKLTPDDIYVSSGECVYPANPAFALGLCAVLPLTVAQITVSVVGGCCGCCKLRGGASESKRVMGIVCSVFSWIAAVIAGVFFVEGAAWNAPVARDTAPACYYLKDGVFRRAAVLSIVAAVLGIKSYIMLRAAAAATATPGAEAGATAGDGEPKPDGQQPQAPGIAIGEPAPGYGQVAPHAHLPDPPPQGYGIQFPPRTQRHIERAREVNTPTLVLA